MRGLAVIQFHKQVGDFGDGDLVALLQPPAPERLQRRTVSGALGDFQRHYFGIENVCYDLPPNFRFGAAAGRPNLDRLDPKLNQPSQTVIHSQRHALGCRAREVPGFERFFVDAEPNARSIRHIGCALAFEVRQKQQAVRPRRNPRHLSGKLFVRPAKIFAHHFRCHCDIHRAEQWQPAVGRVAERGDFALRIDHRFFRTGVNGTAGAEARGDDPGASVAGADGAHHIVAAAGADEDA